MAKGQEETSTNRVGHRRGASWESPTKSILVAAMSVEELRLFCQVPTDISLELLDGAAISIVEWADNKIYFTLEQFVVGLCIPITSLVK